MKFPKLRRSEVKDVCDRNEDGTLTCVAKRVFDDGTETQLAGITVGVDEDCNPIPEHTFDDEEGNLGRLQKKVIPNIVGKCKNRPRDY